MSPQNQSFSERASPPDLLFRRRVEVEHYGTTARETLKVKGLDLEVCLYQVNRTDYVLTNDLRENSVQTIKYNNQMRWHIEEFNREIKQLTGLEKCQCRKDPTQRIHIFCAILVWHRLKQLAYKAYKTIYHSKRLPLKKFPTQQLKQQTPVFTWQFSSSPFFQF